MNAWKPILKLLLSTFVVGGINGVHVYLRDKHDFNLENGLGPLISVFLVAGLTGAATHALNSPLGTDEEKKNDGSSE